MRALSKFGGSVHGVAAAAIAFCLIALAHGEAASQSDVVALVKERQAMMKIMARSFGPVIAVMKGQTTDLTQATAVVEATREKAGQIVSLFPPGTGRNEMAETRAKPEVWSNWAEFEFAATRFVEETEKLAAAGRANDLTAFKAQFRPFAASCSGCHSAKSARGGKFRFPEG